MYLLFIQPAKYSRKDTNPFSVIYWVGYGFFGTLFIWNLIYFVYHYVQSLLTHEKEKIATEKEIWETEARGLRAQMNPHFIFNCINSIKAFILQDEEDEAVNYLVAFSKLMRIILQNSDKKEITLFDELETSRLYVQLERMSCRNKFDYHFEVDEHIDLKSLQIPPLMIQPFIENAIYHGIMPKANGGTITIALEKKNENFFCIIEDNGIGREASKQIKFTGRSSGHESKQVHLIHSRSKADILNQKNVSVEIIDKKDSTNQSTGTKVVLIFNDY